MRRTANQASLWAPLRRPLYRALWIAQMGANIGMWAQTVGAQWLMGDFTNGPLGVALVQAAVTVPMFLLVVPAGALGDIVDRRRLLLVGRGVALVSAAGLAGLTTAGVVTPALLLGMIGVLGVGQGLAAAPSSAIQPELVGLDEVTAAALLDGASFNLARAVGPALGGVLIAAAGPAATFAFNAVCISGVLLVLFAWSRPEDDRPLGAETMAGAVRAGARYVRSAPLFGRVLGHIVMFALFASGLWALLAVLARGPLRLSAAGYGLLLGCLGLGAVACAMALPRARRHLSPGRLVACGAAAYAGCLAVLSFVTWLPVVVATLAIAGAAWVGVQATFTSTAQLLLPEWTRARALGYFQLALTAGQAGGALLWGAVAELLGLTGAFLVPSICLLVGTALARRFLPLPASPVNVSAIQHLPEPPEPGAQPEAGPVLVTVEWHVDPQHTAEFAAAMRPVGQARRRTGATLWGLFHDLEEPSLFLETFTVASWREHLRQHAERGVVMDLETEALARRYLDPDRPPRVQHLIWAYSVDRQRGRGNDR